MEREHNLSDRRKELKRRTMQRQSSLYRKMASVFLVVLALFFVINLIKPKKDFSDAENRMLAKRPQLTWESVKTGKFMSEFESYVSDQFFLRNQWISLKFYEDKLLGKRESNGVYLGKKGYLMEKLSEPDWDNVKKNAEAMKKFAQKHKDIPVYTALVPNAAYILKDKMPANAPVRDQMKDLKEVQKLIGNDIHNIDVAKVMKTHSDEEIYYKTDHHWTSLGARYAFEKIAEDMKIRNVDSEYKEYVVTERFQGTLASKSGYHGSKDAVSVYEPRNLKMDYIVMYTEEGRKTTSIFESEALKEKDKYTVFFGGNHARVDISTTQKERKNLLLFKDSYANCMVQFLLPYYQNIVMIDPRYFYDSVESIITSYGITDVLFLYNMDTFLGDNSIADVLAEEENKSAEDTSAEDTKNEKSGDEDSEKKQGKKAEDESA